MVVQIQLAIYRILIYRILVLIIKITASSLQNAKKPAALWVQQVFPICILFNPSPDHGDTPDDAAWFLFLLPVSEGLAFADEAAQDVGDGQVFGACPVSRGFMDQFFRPRAGIGGQCLDQSGSRRGDEFAIDIGRVIGQSCQEFCRCRCRYGHDAMGTADESAPHVEGRCADLFDMQVVKGPDGPYDIEDAVDGADFMEMDIADGYAVYFGFRFGQGLEYGQALLFDFFRKRRGFDDGRDIGQSPVLMMVMMARGIDEGSCRLHGLAVIVMVVVTVAVAFFVAVVVMMTFFMVMMVMMVLFRVEEDIIIHRLDPQFVDRLADQGIAVQSQLGHGFLKFFKGNACLNQHADEHIATDTGKTVKIQCFHIRIAPLFLYIYI